MAINGDDNAGLDRDDRATTQLNGASTDQPWTVQGVVEKIPGGPPKTKSTSPVPFFHLLERLKTTPREGWRRFGINHGESISDHMYRMAMMTMFAPPSLAAKINIQNCTKMALVHDVAEALVGDITPVDGVPKDEKNRRESTTMDYFTNSLLGRVNGGMTGKDIRAVWQEYEDSETMDSKFVHDVDKIELLLQMFEYERKHQGKLDLGEFTWVATRIVLPETKEWSDTIMKERDDFWDGQEHTSFHSKSLQQEWTDSQQTKGHPKVVVLENYYGAKKENNEEPK